jgi:class 3 adenylate cyclase/tetratricopeptide (TPR) repeat protein
MATCAACGHEADGVFKFCPECGAPAAAAAAPREQRKVVTVLFCDVTGSTALGEQLDPEPLRALLARYFERMKAIIESHGGTVEKFIGDAVMAVFGVPVLHEDDPLRAVRAAVEMRDALPKLGIEGRIGIMTGEVVAGTDERLATGDAVNVAARLEQAASPGEILIGEPTLRLVRSAVEADAVEPLSLKGKAEPVRAFRLVAVVGELRREGAAPMVGRAHQQRRLGDAFASVVADRACHLFTVLGSAGVGKSRLADELLTSLDARVARGRCLSYGEGITYWPVVEVLKVLDARPADAAAAAAVAALLGESEEATAPDAIAWGFRKTLEAAAAEEPLVCVFDDLHWAEPALLDLVEHVADWSREAPILLLCMARPELLDRRPTWGGGKLNATTVLLEPLTREETAELIDRLLADATVGADLRARVADAADGNPLFVEEMLALVRESGNGEVAVPPSIHALLAARLDQLDPAERAVLERGAIEGKIFHRGSIEALAPDEPQVRARLMALVRRELVRPEQSVLAGDDAFRFRHLLIRDAAYDALPKATRAELHRRFADWLATHGGELVELDEILGYHLEHACLYRRELGGDIDEELAAAARRHLRDAAARAVLRQDHSAAATLFKRAAFLMPPGTVDPLLEYEAVRALYFAGEIQEASSRAAAAADHAASHGDRRAELPARIWEVICRSQLAPEGAVAQLNDLIEEGRSIYRPDRPEDCLGLQATYEAMAVVAHMRGQGDRAVAALERSLEYARKAGLAHPEVQVTAAAGAQRWFGSTSTTDLLEWLAQQEQSLHSHPALPTLRAGALAMRGRSDDARAVHAQLLAELRERDNALALTVAINQGVFIELILGSPEGALRHSEEACRRFRAMGERSWLSTTLALQAEAHYQLGRLEEADAEAREAAELGAADDAATEMISRQVRAKILARRGAAREAERLAREAVEIAETTEMLDAEANAYADLAEVLELVGDVEGAEAALEAALARYERKENLPSAERARMRLAGLTTG